MGKSAYHILRIGLGLTFAWIGVMILQNPDAWGGYLQPWALNLLPVPVRTVMIGTGWFDIALGTLLIINIWPRLFAALGALHIAVVLVTAGVNAITVRDIGLLAGALALASSVKPAGWRMKQQ